MGDGLSGEVHGSFGRRQHPYDRFEQSGFTRTVSTDQAYPFALFHLQADATHRLDVAVGNCQVFNG